LKPILFKIPGLNLPIHAYGVMVVVGFILAIMLSTRRAKKRSLDPNLILDLGVYVIVFGIIGARIWFVYQFKDEFDLGVLNIFDGRLSIIGAVLGIAFVALLYFYRGRIEFLSKLRTSKRSVKLTFIVIGVVAAILFSRAFYCLFEREANVHIAYVNDPSLFYPESLRREVVGTLGSGSGEGSAHHESSVFRIVGRYASGPNVPKIDTVAYEFPKYRYGNSSEEVKRFRVEEALLRKLGVVRLQSAFYYDFLEIWKGGLVYYGGVIGAVAGGLLFSYRRKFPFWKLADLVAPGVALGLAGGRIGCLLNGCCWGKIPATLLPEGFKLPPEHLAQQIVAKGIPLLDRLSYTFPHGSNAFQQQVKAGLLTEASPKSLPVYPTQVIESVAAVALCLIVLAFSKHKKRDGEEILLLGMLYPVVRFLIELLRADNEPQYLFGLTISQAAGILIFIFCAFLFILRRFIAKPVGFSPPVIGKRQK
jgi:phosphatidylglycerol:prolipoprotein diacylglycerol transferase